MKRLAAVALAALVLTGCAVGSSEPGGGPEKIVVQDVSTPDGRTVTCAVYTKADRGGITCDWEGAR